MQSKSKASSGAKSSHGPIVEGLGFRVYGLGFGV